MFFDEMRELVQTGNLPETPRIIRYNESYVRDRGNYHVLADMALELASILGKDGEAIRDEMLAGTYENMLLVWAREFNEIVTIQPLTAEELAAAS